jgi:hypothetical protein
MQRENERARIVAIGRRIDDGSKCTLLVVRETGGPWVVYPHGVGQFGVRLPKDEAERMARAILADGAR